MQLGIDLQLSHNHIMLLAIIARTNGRVRNREPVEQGEWINRYTRELNDTSTVLGLVNQDDRLSKYYVRTIEGLRRRDLVRSLPNKDLEITESGWAALMLIKANAKSLTAALEQIEGLR